MAKKKKSKEKIDKAWVVAVNMGYGHERAAYNLKNLAYGDIMIANDYEGIPKKDRNLWRDSRKFYEMVSRASHLPIIGDEIFELFDKWQEIKEFYPRRDLSKPNYQTKKTYEMIQEKEWGRDLIEYLNKDPRPLVSTFFFTAFAAEVFGYKNDIYCVVCDADISRNWAPLNPQKSRIKYLAPCQRAAERLKLYGVKEENIYLSGFPLPKENINGRGFTTLKKDMSHRLYNLDPKKVYAKKYGSVIKTYLGAKNFPKKSDHPLTLMFAVGGAGAQREIGETILKSLKKKIINDEIKLILVAGSRSEVSTYFKNQVLRAGMKKELGKGVEILYCRERRDYFQLFNERLRKTDIVWTKPSEVSFYAGLGLPIIMAPSIGSQEEFNRSWLKSYAAGITQRRPEYAHEWLFDWINDGRLARAAMHGFTEVPKLGSFKIEDIVLGRKERFKESLIV